MNEECYVYILRCCDGSFYTGWTNDLPRRLQAHNSGRGAKYTKTRRPVEMIYYEQCSSRSEALKREYAIKQFTHAQKQKLIAGMQRKDEINAETDHN